MLDSLAFAMQCTLLIPHLFWPHETADAVLRGLALPHLTRLVSRARAERDTPATPEAWLCAAFGVERQQDWPVAPLTLKIDGGESGNAYWLRADPVHIKVERDRLLLVDNTLFDVSSDEAETFAGLINKHFENDGFAFQARAPKRWYLSLPQPPRLITCSPGEVAGNDVRTFLPAGADALVWHRIFNEVQMLLHEHALNEAREARGEAAVNSVWFWGGGVQPAVRGSPFQAVWSGDALARSLAAETGASARPLPADGAAWLDLAVQSKHASHLVIIDDLSAATRYGDMEAWRSRISALDAQWLAPLIAALRRGRLEHLTLVATGRTSSWRFTAGRTDLLKFWRSTPSLAAYA